MQIFGEKKWDSNAYMAYTIEQKFHLVIFLHFRDHRTHKCTPEFSKHELKDMLKNLDNIMVPTI